MVNLNQTQTVSEFIAVIRKEGTNLTVLGVDLEVET